MQNLIKALPAHVNLPMCSLSEAERSDLVSLFVGLRNAGCQLPESLTTLHEMLTRYAEGQHQNELRKEAAREERARVKALPARDRSDLWFELAIDSDPAIVSPTLRKKIRALHPKANVGDARGDCSTRFIKVPNTLEGRALLAEVANRSTHQRTVIVRHITSSDELASFGRRRSGKRDASGLSIWNDAIDIDGGTLIECIARAVKGQLETFPRI